MSARRRGRRYGGVNETTVPSGATVTGPVGTNGSATESGRGALVDGMAVDNIPGTDDADARAEDAGRLGNSGNGVPRRSPRTWVRTSTDSPAATESPVAPTAPATAAAIRPDESEVRKPACTLAQMRRFIKSRPYVPVHELRRRFLIEGDEEDVSAVPTEQGIVYVGLPVSEAQFLADLIRAGEVGCELLLDPTSPAVIGVYAMRPVARQ